MITDTNNSQNSPGNRDNNNEENDDFEPYDIEPIERGLGENEVEKR